VRVRLWVTPGASAERVLGVVADGDGPRLRLTVAAPPEKGQANARVIQVLARLWDLPRSAITVAQGMASRRKTVLVAGDPEGLMRRLLGSVPTASGDGGPAEGGGRRERA
jgi:uncharacterized protein YggU (UPF0235/DUF167 family)